VPKHNYSLQSRALRDNTLYIAEKPVLPCRGTQVYFDIEGVPDKDFYCLIGVLIVKPGSSDFHSFWADSKDQQQHNWNSFLEALGQIDEFDLLHYGKYDQQFLRQMRRRYGGKTDLLDRIDSCSFDVLSAIRSHVYFPVLCNDLKSIASCLGFSWSADGASGLDSIVWHDEWERSGNASMKDKLIQYNKDDCLALATVATFLRALSDDQLSEDTVHLSKIANSCELESKLPYRFQKQKFFFPDLDHIKKCSYFDYQKNRIYLRSKERRQKLPTKVRCLTKKTTRVNKSVLHAKPELCDRCGSNELMVRASLSKDISDLKFFQGGVKAWK
jgi:hypothetical protein